LRTVTHEAALLAIGGRIRMKLHLVGSFVWSLRSLPNVLLFASYCSVCGGTRQIRANLWAAATLA
jgi:hypothetical protein